MSSENDSFLERGVEMEYLAGKNRNFEEIVGNYRKCWRVMPRGRYERKNICTDTHRDNPGCVAVFLSPLSYDPFNGPLPLIDAI